MVGLLGSSGTRSSSRALQTGHCCLLCTLARIKKHLLGDLGQHSSIQMLNEKEVPVPERELHPLWETPRTSSYCTTAGGGKRVVVKCQLLQTWEESHG